MTLRVLMSGDSAGGNLVAAMHVYMQQHNLQKFMADHLLLVYATILTPLTCLQYTRYHLITPTPACFSYSVFMVSCTAMTPR